MLKKSRGMVCLFAGLSMLLCAGTAACQKEEGALEKAGKQADSLLKKAGEAAKDVAEKTEEGGSK